MNSKFLYLEVEKILNKYRNIISFEYKWLNSTDGPCPGGNPSLWNIPPTPFFANPNMSDAWVPQLRIISGSTILARKLILDNPNSWTTEVLEYTIPDPAPPSIYFRFNKRGDLFQQNLVPKLFLDLHKVLLQVCVFHLHQ